MKTIERKCYTCSIVKDITEFNKSKKDKQGYSYQCRCCSKNEHMYRRYGVSIKEYNRMFEDQKGCCAICGIHQSKIKRSLDIDHCHTEGTVRGLLCNKCNQAIGLFKDDLDIIKKAIKYLETKQKAI